MKVFRLNDYDWVGAETMEQAIEWYLKEFNLDRDEVYDERECDLDKETVIDIDSEDEQTITMREALEKEFSEWETPFLFASTEY